MTSAPGPPHLALPAATAAVHQGVSLLERPNTELLARLEERGAELEAARR
ncbi:hypothetical protein OHT76_41540 [Streptomyces sp. NBC_00287]|nr:hypothetical protein [Streptomyces sp. NBC_00287]